MKTIIKSVAQIQSEIPEGFFNDQIVAVLVLPINETIEYYIGIGKDNKFWLTTHESFGAISYETFEEAKAVLLASCVSQNLIKQSEVDESYAKEVLRDAGYILPILSQLEDIQLRHTQDGAQPLDPNELLAAREILEGRNCTFNIDIDYAISEVLNPTDI